MKPRFSLTFLGCIAAPAVLVITTTQVQAATNYQGATDDWTNTANWSGGVVPTGAFNQRLNFNGGTTVTFGVAQGTVSVGAAAGESRSIVLGNVNPNASTGTATLNITGGVLQAGTAAATSSLVGANGASSVGILNVSGGILDLTTATTAAGRVLSIGLGATANTGISGTVNLSGSGLIKVGEFRIGDSAPNTGGSITGVLHLNGGTLETGALRELSTGGTGSALITSTVNLNGGLLKLTAATGISSSLDTVNVLSGANIEVVTGVTAASGKDLIAVGVGGLTKTGDGTLTLTNASTYTGATSISAGTLSAGKIDVSGGNSSLGNATGAVTLGSAGSQGTLSYSGNSATYTRGFTIGGAGGGRLDVTTSGQTLTVDTGAITGSGLFTIGGTGQKIINAAISHSGGLTKTASSGSITLSNGLNTYDGVTTINGALIVTANNALGTAAGGTTLNASSALGLSGGIDYSTLEAVSGSGVGTGPIAGITPATSRGFIQSTSGNNTFRGDITVNAAGVSRIGSQDGASLTLTGVITQSAGTMLFRPGDLNGDYVTLSNSGNSFAANQTIYSNYAGTGNYAGLRLGVNNALPTTLTIFGETGTGTGTALNLNGFNQKLNGLTGSTTLNIINSNTSTASTLRLDNLVDRSTTGTLIRGGAGLGTINVIKEGTFTQTLSGTHDYTGTTEVNAGTLLINGNISTSSLTTVASGATLGGTGTVGAVTVLGGGNLAPGTSPGTLSTGIVSLASTSNLNFELNPLNLTVGGGINDLVSVTGNLTLDGILNLTPTSGDFLTAIAGNAWRLFNYSGSLTDSTLALGTMPALGSGLSWNINTATANQVNLVIIPEPSAVLLGGIGFLALLRRRR